MFLVLGFFEGGVTNKNGTQKNNQCEGGKNCV